MTFIQCQDGSYINAEAIQELHIEDNYDGALISDQCIMAKMSSGKYNLGYYPIAQTGKVLEQLIMHLTTNRTYDMPKANEEDERKCVLTTV